MATFESVYVHVGDVAPLEVYEAVRQALVALRQSATVRLMNGLPWVQISASGDAGDDVAVATRMKLRKASPPDDASIVETLAFRLSLLVPADVVSLEAQTSVDYSAFARFRSGATLRRYACCPEEPGLIMQDTGLPEPWEAAVADSVSGIQPRAIAMALRLPGFESGHSWDHETDVEL